MAGAQLGDLRTDGLDHAGNIPTPRRSSGFPNLWHHPRHVREPGHQVPNFGSASRRMHPDKDIALSDHRVRNVPELQHVRRAVPVLNDGLHRSLLYCRTCFRTSYVSRTLYEMSTRGDRGAVRGIDKDRVVRAAIELADRDGLESLTMRKLADALGVGTMSAYYYVANKDALLDEMVDVVYSEIEPPGSDAGWKTAMRDLAFSVCDALRRHPWATPLMESRAEPGPANLRHHDHVLRLLVEAGFTIEMAVHAYNAIDSYVYGFALQERNLPFESPDKVRDVAEHILARAAEEYPYLARVTAQFAADYDYRQEFAFGLDLLLDGIENVAPTGARGTAPDRRTATGKRAGRRRASGS